MIPYSVLDLSPVPEGGTAADALANSLDLARHAEAWGYRRFWLAEHHNMTGHRQRRDRGRDRPRRRRHLDHPRRRRRHHAAEPRAAGDRRAVRHAGDALSRPHRPRPRPRAGHRHGDGAGAAPRPRRRRQLPAGRGRADRLLRAEAGPSRACARCRAWAPTCRSGSSAPASTAPSSPPISACPTPSPRISRRRRSTQAIDGLPRDLPAVGALAAAAFHAGDQRLRRRDRRRGRPPDARSMQQAFANLRTGQPGPLPRPVDDIDA